MDARTAIIGAGFAFCCFFGAATVYAVVDSGFSGRGVVLGAVSLAIVFLIGLGLLGAIRNRPPRR